MSDIERDLDELGRQVWPYPERVLRRLRSGDGQHRQGRGRRFGRPFAALLGTVGAIVVIGGVSAGGIVALEHHVGGTGSTADNNGTSASVAPAVTGGHSTPVATAAALHPSASARISPGARISASPSLSVTPPPTGSTLVVTAGSRGTYEVKLGTTIVVDLTGGTSNSRWSMPSSTPAQVVRFERGTQAAAGGISATFVAVGTGRATIEAAESPHCPPVCGPPSYLWRIEIIVVA
jgi:hypothetical protein